MLCMTGITFLARDLSSSGSNLPASSSFAMTRAIFKPSADDGGARAPPANAWPTVSFILIKDFDRKWVSKLERAFRMRMASGLSK
jgi:hypothetical protein